MPTHPPNPGLTSDPAFRESNAGRADRGLRLGTPWGLALLFFVAVLGPLVLFCGMASHVWIEGSFPWDVSLLQTFGLAMAVTILAWQTRWRWTAVAAGVGFVLAIGLSRVYLGVHYPSDVLGAWLLAWAWVGAAAFVRSGQAMTRLLATPWRQCAAYGLMLALLPTAYVGRVLSEDNFHDWSYSIAMDRSFWRYVSNHVADGAIKQRPAR